MFAFIYAIVRLQRAYTNKYGVDCNNSKRTLEDCSLVVWRALTIAEGEPEWTVEKLDRSSRVEHVLKAEELWRWERNISNSLVASIYVRRRIDVCYVYGRFDIIKL